MYLTAWKTSLACKRVSKFVGRGVPRAKAPAPLTVWFSRAVLHRLRARKPPKFPLTPFSPIFAHSAKFTARSGKKLERRKNGEKKRKRSGENGERSGEKRGKKRGKRGKKRGKRGKKRGKRGKKRGKRGKKRGKRGKGKTARKAEKKTGKNVEPQLWHIFFEISTKNEQNAIFSRNCGQFCQKRIRGRKWVVSRESVEMRAEIGHGQIFANFLVGEIVEFPAEICAVLLCSQQNQLKMPHWLPSKS